MKGTRYPYLACGVRLFWDEVRQQHFLLFPEGAIKLNQTAWAILERCGSHGNSQGSNQHRTIDDIISELMLQFPNANVGSDVHELITKLAQRGLITYDIS
jgi:pyrroloquinoline quinone biosynthesis protein D